MKSVASTVEMEENTAAMEAHSAPQDHGPTSDRREQAMGRDVQELPAGYFTSVRFIGSYCVSVDASQVSVS
jgi:hypothetical protein